MTGGSDDAENVQAVIDHPGKMTPDLRPPSPEALRQLSLFQTFYGSTTPHDRLSNVIEIWDAAPKYVTPRRQATLYGQTPTVLERSFVYRGTRFQMAVAPVIFRDARGRDVVRLPTAREELIEDALRYIAVRRIWASSGPATAMSSSGSASRSTCCGGSSPATVTASSIPTWWTR